MIYIWLALISALSFSISDISTKYLLNNNITNIHILFWGRGILILILTIIMIVITSYYGIKIFSNETYIDTLKISSPKMIFLLIISGIMSFMGYVCLLYAFNISKNIGYIVPIVSTTSLFTLVLSRIFFKTKTYYIGVIGSLLILLGVFCISKCPN